MTARLLQSVPEIVEPFVPLPDDLMVNLKESRSVIDTLLDSLPTAFGRTGTVSVQLARPTGASRTCIAHFVTTQYLLHIPWSTCALQGLCCDA